MPTMRHMNLLILLTMQQCYRRCGNGPTLRLRSMIPPMRLRRCGSGRFVSWFDLVKSMMRLNWHEEISFESGYFIMADCVTDDADADYGYDLSWRWCRRCGSGLRWCRRCGSGFLYHGDDADAAAPDCDDADAAAPDFYIMAMMPTMRLRIVLPTMRLRRCGSGLYVPRLRPPDLITDDAVM